MAQQTAVEWFWEWQMDNPLANFKDAVDVYKQAKQMEKHQIIAARMDNMTDDELSYETAEQYYNETYGNKS